MEKKILSVVVSVVLLLGACSPVLADTEEVPAEVAVDFVAGAMPENLITTYPTEGNLNINAGEVRTQATGSIATFSAVADCNGHGSLGLQGFNIDRLFIPSLPGTGYTPAFSKGAKVLFSGKVRKTQDATADTRINIVYASEGYGKQYYPDNYPTGASGLLLTGTEWADFKTIMTAPEDFGGQYWYFLFGFANGTKTGAKAELDMSTLYFGEEVAYDMQLKAESKTDIEAGTDAIIRADADVLNQLGDVCSTQGTFNWYALDETRTHIIPGITVVPEENGEASVYIGASVPAGNYVIAAQSAEYPEMVKSFTVTVGTKDWSDHEAVVAESWYKNPEMSNNWSANVDGQPAFTIGQGTVGTTITSTDLIANHGDMKDRLMGTYFPEMVGAASDNITKQYPVGTRFVVSFKVRNLTPDKTAKVNAALYAWGELYSITPDAYPSVAYDDCFTIEGEDWNEFFGVITLKKQLSLEWYSLDIGYPDGTEPGTSIEIDGTSFYFAPYKPCDIRVTDVAGTGILDPGVASAYTAQITDHAGYGMEGDFRFDWALIREDKTARVPGVTFTEDGAEVLAVADKSVAPGRYFIAAESKEGETAGWIKSIPVTVLKPAVQDFVPGSIPGEIYAIDVTRTDPGEQTMGLTDMAEFSASVLDKNGAPVAGKQNFVWVVMDEARREDVSDFFTVTPSEDTASASVLPKLTTTNGTYYVMAQQKENEEIVKAVKIVIDKAQSVADGAELINKGEAPEIEEKLSDIAVITEVSEELLTVLNEATGTVKKETAGILAESFGKDNTVSGSDMAAVANAIEKAIVISLYRENPTSVTLFDAKGNFTYAEELSLSEIDTNGVTLYHVFMTVLSDEGRIAVQTALKTDKTTTLNDFAEKLQEHILLCGIRYPDALGVSYLEDILTEKNLNAAGVEAPEYLARKDKGETHKEIARTLYTKETLTKALEAEEPEEEKEKRPSGGGGGGVSGGGGYKPSAQIPVQKETEAEKETAFPKFCDVSEEHWAYKDIYYLRERGIINGIEENSFMPDGNITREQFAKILCTALELETTNTPTGFADADTDAWYTPYISAVYHSGIVTGTDQNTFGVGKSITRQDLCTMLYRAMDDEKGVYTETGFADGDQIAEYAKEAVAFMKETGIVNGYEDGTFRPVGFCTRAEAAKIICKFLSVQEVLK